MAVIPLSPFQKRKAGSRLLRVTVTVSGYGEGWGKEGILDAEELEEEIQRALEDKSKMGGK